MKLIILKNNLLEGLFAVEKSIGENNNLPILKNVLISAENNIKLITTNLELAITFNLMGKIINKGKACIPLITFYNIIKNLNAEKIELEAKNNNLSVKTENHEINLYGQNPDDFPIIPRISLKNDNNIIFNLKIFKEVLNRVIVACQFSEIRPELSGIYFNFNNNFFKIVSTDSFRLIEEILPNESFKVKNKKFDFILPLKTAQEILKIVNSENEKEINFIFDDNQILIKTEKIEIISRLINGQFPDYESVLPKEIKHEIELNRQELINALKLSSFLTSKANDVTLKLEENKKILEIFSSDNQLGENRCILPIKFLKGDNFVIAFNWRFLMDGLKIYDTENVILGINDYNSSFKASIIKSKNQNIIYILMPLRI